MSKQLEPNKFNTDKGVGYLRQYSKIFEKFINSEVHLLELGVLNGGSLDLWADYFPRGSIVGIDINQVHINSHNGRVKFYQGDQSDIKFLRSVSHEVCPHGFDIIIDDASHFAKHTEISFLHLYREALKPGGIYVIEDWGTGYWSKWPDGKDLLITNSHIISKLRNTSALGKASEPQPIRYESHDFGIVGLVKQLIDELSLHDVTKSGLTNNAPMDPLIDYMIIAPGQVFLFKPN